MNSVRYFVALFLVISLPPVFLYWLLVHPFVNFWRGQGIGVTYGCLLAVITAGMVDDSSFSFEHRVWHELSARRFRSRFAGAIWNYALYDSKQAYNKSFLRPSRSRARSLSTRAYNERSLRTHAPSTLRAISHRPRRLCADRQLSRRLSHGLTLGAGRLHHRAARGKRITRSLWRRLHRVLPSGSALCSHVKSATSVE